jgi:hypothetical protein
MQARVYRFDDGAWRRPPDGIDPAGFHRFLRQFDCLLRRLSDLHLRISLARLPVAEQGGEAARLGNAIADNLLDPCAVAGVMPDGGVVAAFLGPRDSDSAVGDEEMTERITRRFERAVRAARPGASLPASALTVVHCWSDEIYDVPSLVLELASVHQSRRGGATTVELKVNRQPA